jgi:hypothetical protein
MKMASTHRIPQLGTAVGLEQAVLKELKQIHGRGLKSIDPSTTPFIAELALGENGDAETYVEAAEELLHTVLAQMSGFDRFSSQSLREGIAELLGIGEKKWKSQADRFDNAALALEYKNGNSLRKTVRERIPKRTRYVWEECLERLAARIVATATERGFVCKGRFGYDQPARKPQILAKRTLGMVVDGEHFTISPVVGAELEIAFQNGLATAYRDGFLPQLVRFADAVVDGGNTELHKLEALLIWALEAIEARPLWVELKIPEISALRQGATELLGLGDRDDLPLAERERRALDCFYRPDDRRRHTHWNLVLALITEGIARPLVGLAIYEKVVL